MKKVLIRGPLVNTAGYGVHARQVFSYLESREDCDISTQITPWGICTYQVNTDYEDGLIGRILKKSYPSNKIFDVSFQVQLPSEWDPEAAKFNIGVTAGVETTRCSQSWVEAVNKMDLVIVPSKFTKETIENSGEVKTKILVIPEYIQPQIFEEKFEPIELKLKTSFNFLMFGLLTGTTPETDRKNTFYGIKWLCETFKEDPEVGVVIKTSLGRMSYMDRSNTVKVLSRLIKEVRTGPYPRFYLSHGMMTSEEVSSFYRSPQLNALVSFTRGEGYGLPLLEAAASGLPVMATNWSGHKDFLSKIRFSSFDYDLIDVDKERIDNSVFVSGAKWAQVREKEAKRKLKKIRTSYEIPKQWAEDGKEILRKSLNSKEVFKIYEEHLSDILS